MIVGAGIRFACFFLCRAEGDTSESSYHWSQSQAKAQPLAPRFSYPLITPELDVIIPYGRMSENPLVFCRKFVEDDDDDAVMMKHGDSEDLFGPLPWSATSRGGPSLGTHSMGLFRSSTHLGLGSRQNSSSMLGLGSRQGSSNLGPFRNSSMRNKRSSSKLCSESSSCSSQHQSSTMMHIGSSLTHAGSSLVNPVRHVRLGAFTPTLIKGSMIQSNPSLTNARNQSNPRNQYIPRIPSNAFLTNPSMNLMEQRIISANQITSTGLWVGTAPDNLPRGTPTRNSLGGTPTRNSLGGTPTRESSGGTPTRKLSGGTPTRESSGGTPTRKLSGGTPTHEPPSSTASCKWLSGTGQVLPPGTGRERTGDSRSRLLGKSAVGSDRIPAYIMTDLEDFRSCHPRTSLPRPSLSNAVPAFLPDDAAKCSVSAWGEESFDHSRMNAGKVKAFPSPFEQLPDAPTINVKEVSKLRKLFSCFGSS
eukprot:gene29346-12441_t